MPVDQNIITSILNEADKIFVNSTINIRPIALSLLFSICVIDLVLAFVLNHDNPDQVKMLISKVLKYGMFVYIVTNWSYLLNVLLESGKKLGIIASGNPASEILFGDPSQLAARGVKIALQVIQQISILDFALPTGTSATLSIRMFSAFMIMLCFFGIALNLFFTYIEFYIIGILSLGLIPFGANKFTSFIAQKCSNSLVTITVKVMVITFIAGFVHNVTKGWVLKEPIDSLVSSVTDPIQSLQTIFFMLLGSLAMLGASWQVPRIVTSLMHANPSFNANQMIGSAIGSSVNVAQTVAMAKVSGGASLAAGAAQVSNAVKNASAVPHSK